MYLLRVGMNNVFFIFVFLIVPDPFVSTGELKFGRDLVKVAKMGKYY